MAFHNGAHGVENVGIIKDGLLLWVHASTLSSYPGSGTTWSTLEGSTDLTLNGATFDTTYTPSLAKTIDLDGSNDTITCSSITCGNIWTQQCFFKPKNQSSGGYGYFNFGWNAVSEGGNNGFTKKLYIYNGSAQGVSTSTLETDTWYHITWVFNTTDSTVKVYLNGTLDKTTTISGTFNTSTYRTFTGFGNYSAGAHQLNGKVANFLIYNRELTASEVFHNFHIERSRFGI